MRVRLIQHKQQTGEPRHSAIVIPETRGADDPTVIYGTSLHDDEAAAAAEAESYIQRVNECRGEGMSDTDAAERFQNRIAAQRRAARFNRAEKCADTTGAPSHGASYSNSGSSQPERQRSPHSQRQSSLSF